MVLTLASNLFDAVDHVDRLISAGIADEADDSGHGWSSSSGPALDFMTEQSSRAALANVTIALRVALACRSGTASQLHAGGLWCGVGMIPLPNVGRALLSLGP